MKSKLGIGILLLAAVFLIFLARPLFPFSRRVADIGDTDTDLKDVIPLGKPYTAASAARFFEPCQNTTCRSVESMLKNT